MPTEIDAFEFTRAARSVEGCEPVDALVRLASLLASREGLMAWRVDGWRQSDASGQDRMHLRLRASGTVGMACGRCLGVVTLPVAIDRTYLLVPSESEAAKLDEVEDEVDVLVASRRFQIDELIEDETILALPPAASHARCERPASAASDRGTPAPAEAAAPQSPFAALNALKSKRSS